MKVEHLKVTGFEEALRGMRNAYDSWDKADTEIIRNIIPNLNSDKFNEKLKKYPFNVEFFGRTVFHKDYNEDGNINQMDNQKERICYNPWTQKYLVFIDDAVCENYDIPVSPSYLYDIDTDNVVLLGPNDLDLAQRLVSHDNTYVNGGEPNAKFLRDIDVSLDLTASFDFWKEYDTYKVGTVANSCSTMHTITKHPITIENISVADLREKDINNIEKIWLPILNDVVNDDSISNIEKTRILSKMNILGFEQKRTIKLNYEVIKNMNIWRKGHKLYEWRKLINVYFKNLPYAASFFDPKYNLYLHK